MDDESLVLVHNLLVYGSILHFRYQQHGHSLLSLFCTNLKQNLITS